MNGARWGAWAVGALLCLFAWLSAGAAEAHEFRPGRLDATAVAPGRYVVHFVPPTSGASAPMVHWPRWCADAGPLVDCGVRDLAGGTLRISGLGAREDVVVHVRGGPVKVATVLSAADPEVRFSELAASGTSETWTHYLRRGVEHVLSGADHLLFLLGMVWIVAGAGAGRRRNRRLLLTVTSFTLAHSLTLGLSVLGFVHVASPPVETAIALSVLLLAVEAARGRPDTLTARWPWAVAFGFGLVHGLGFAGALLESGIPESGRLVALVGFNLGVEAGQVGVVALLLSAVAALGGVQKSQWTAQMIRRHRWVPRLAVLRLVPIYAAGVVAFAWTLERALTLGGPG